MWWLVVRNTGSCANSYIFGPYGKLWLEAMVAEIHEPPSAEFSTAEFSIANSSPTRTSCWSCVGCISYLSQSPSPQSGNFASELSCTDLGADPQWQVIQISALRTTHPILILLKQKIKSIFFVEE